MTESNVQKKTSIEESNADNTLKKDKEKLAEEFLKTVNSKLKKSEKEIWMIHDHDHDHLLDNQK